MILLQAAIFVGMVMVGIVKFLLFILVPLIVIIRTITHIYQSPEEKLKVKDFFLIFLKNLLYAVAVIIIIGFTLFLLMSILMPDID